MKIGYEEELQKYLAPFSLEEIVGEIRLKFRNVTEFTKDDLLGKISCLGIAKNRKYRLEFKKYHYPRYGNILPGMLESFFGSNLLNKEMKNTPLVLVVRVKKLSNSFLGNVLQFLGKYKARDLNWLMIDDLGKMVGHFEGEIIEQHIRARSAKTIHILKRDSKQKLSFSPIQQWLLKCLLLNGIQKEMKMLSYKLLWPLEQSNKIHDYRVLSKISQVSESSSFNFLKLLQEHEYLSINDYKCHFKNLSRLFDLWKASFLSESKYEIYLSPTKPIESISSWRRKVFQLFEELNFNSEDKIIMSGHLACREVGLSWSNNQSVIFYLDSNDDELLAQFMKKMRLQPSKNAKDEIRIISQKSDYPVLKLAEFEKHKIKIADPIQLMLDVLYLGGRGLEQSEYIYEKLLMKHFRKQKWMN